MSGFFLLGKSNEIDLLSTDTYDSLLSLQDDNEKYNRKKFDGFTDLDMVYWYIYQRKNIRISNENNERTKYEYTRELKQFINNILKYGHEIGLDLDMDLSHSLLKNIESRHLRRYQEWLVNSSPRVVNNRGYSPATIARKTTIIKSFFVFLFENKYTTHDAAKGLKTASVRADDRPNRDLGPSEVTFILNSVEKEDYKYYTVILTLVTTGLRNQELCNLNLGDIKKDFITNEFYFEVVGKGNKRRDVPIKHSVMKAIIAYRRLYNLSEPAVGDVEEPIFTTASGNRYSPSYLAQSLKKVIIKSTAGQLGKSVTAHSFRHAYAIISHINKVDIYDIMRSLGHEKIDTTMIYLEKVTSRSKNAMHSWSDDSLGKHFN